MREGHTVLFVNHQVNEIGHWRFIFVLMGDHQIGIAWQS
jgi:hypothetical protein